MSKQKLEQRKKRKKEQRRRENLARFRESDGYGIHQDDDTLELAEALLGRRQFQAARSLLLPFAEKRPKWPEPLQMLAKVCESLNDHPTVFWATEKLIQLIPNDYDAHARYHNACYHNEMPASMVRTAKEMKRRFPAEELDKNIENVLALEPKIAEQIKIEATEMGDDLSSYSDEQLLEFKGEQERCLLYLQSRRFDLVIRICDGLIARFPFFRSAYNNKALAILMDQGAEQADRALNQALEHHPDNVYALAFKIRQLALLGRRDDIPPLVERLRKSTPLSPNKLDHYLMQMEALAWVRDEELLLETFREAVENTSEEWNIDRQACVLMTHFAATAHAIRGEKSEAILLWKKAKKSENALPIVLENLQDIFRPDGERNGPWYFDIDHWVPGKFFSDLIRAAQEHEIAEEEDVEERERITERYILPLYTEALRRWPYLKTTAVDMLRYGDSHARNWVRMTINKNSSPELVAALREFVAGSDGSDECRFGLVNEMSKYGFLESGRMTRWSRGKQDDQYVFAFEITHEGSKDETKLSRQGLRESSRAFVLLREHKEEEALGLLEKINAREPDDRTVLFNMAVCKEALGLRDDYRALIERVVRLYPDYFFAKISLARQAIQEKRPDDAFPYLMELLKAKRLHVTEASSLMSLLTMYHLAKGETNVAKSIHDIGQSIIDEHFPSFRQLQYEVGGISMPRLVGGNLLERLRSLVR